MNYFLLDGVIRSQSVLDKAGENASSAGEAASGAASTGMMGGGIGFTVIYFVIIIVVFYFFAIKPQRKKEKQLRALQDEIKVGDWVLIDSGMYGKVSGVSENVFTIEFGTNKGVLIPVLKQRIVAKAEPNFSNSAE